MSAAMACAICGCPRPVYEFMAQGYRVCECPDCGLLFFDPQPDEPTLAAIHARGDRNPGENEASWESVADMKRATAALYADELVRYHGRAAGRLVEIGCGRGELLAQAQRRGFEVEGLDPDAGACAAAQAAVGPGLVRCGVYEQAAWQDGAYDVCVLIDVLQHVRDPLALLRRAHALLKPGGTLFVVTPSLDTLSARLLKRRRMEFKPEHLFYFDHETSRNAVAKAGFRRLEVKPNVKALTPAYVHRHFQRFRVPVVSALLGLAFRLLPQPLRRWRLRLRSSSLNLLARKEAVRARPLLSVVVPVYNEKATFVELMTTLLAKQVEGLDKEIILVESNSTDGTRDLVRGFEGREGVRVVYEETPRGKGHAVRTGLAVAQGDLVMIQDGDLEYDLNDYDQLLLPLMRHQCAFVLGSRHTGSWKIREFTHQPLLSMVANSAHLFFAFLLNTACGSRLRDPFTMYKVFRRDCIWDVLLKGNRFDFDWEIVIKLLRKGYRPLEVPVNYRSRSWGEGKKIRIFRDPPTWVWALVRFRLGQLYK